jgi:glycosyltransferase involved in cell wall biosynthesis
MGPYISVIITAFNRQDFVHEAIESTLRQTLGKEDYEVIVLNNFNDPSFDAFCRASKILSIKYSEREIGQMIARGIMAANGEIICFLDDDDTFNCEKLFCVKELFTGNSDIIYYHNDAIYTDIHLNPIDSLNLGNVRKVDSIFLADDRKDESLMDFLKHVHRFGTSCISVRKSLLMNYFEGIKSLRVSPDIFITACAMLSTGAVYSDSRKLTKYRVWEKQWSSYRKDRTEEGIRTIYSRAVDSTYGYEVLSQLALTSFHTKVRRYIYGVLLARTVSCSILNPSPSRKCLIAAWRRFIADKGLVITITLLIENATRLSVLSTIAYLILPKLSRTIFIRIASTI